MEKAQKIFFGTFFTKNFLLSNTLIIFALLINQKAKQ